MREGGGRRGGRGGRHMWLLDRFGVATITMNLHLDEFVGV